MDDFFYEPSRLLVRLATLVYRTKYARETLGDKSTGESAPPGFLDSLRAKNRISELSKSPVGHSMPIDSII